MTTLAALVDKPDVDVAIASLQDEGVHDDSRRLVEYDGETIAIPVTEPPQQTQVRDVIEQVDPDVVVPTGKHATTSVLALEDRTVDSFLDTVLDPIDCPELGVTVVPLLHPSYRDVWVSRLGHTNDSYEQRVADVLREVTRA